MEPPTPKVTYDDVTDEQREAVHAARDAAQKLEIARQQQILSIGDMVQERVENVLARGTEQEKSIILARVPYICQDIKEINKKFDVIMDKMDQVKVDLDAKDEKNDRKYLTQESFAPYRWVFGIIGSVVITAIVAALLTKIFIK